MAEGDSPTAQALPLATRIVQGAGLAGVLVVLYLTFGSTTEPGRQLWMIVPILAVSVAGGAGGALHHSIEPFRARGGWRRWVGLLAGIAGYAALVLSAFWISMDGRF